MVTTQDENQTMEKRYVIQKREGMKGEVVGSDDDRQQAWIQAAEMHSNTGATYWIVDTKGVEQPNDGRVVYILRTLEMWKEDVDGLEEIE